MRGRVYGIWDVLSGDWSSSFLRYFTTPEAAIRWFRDAIAAEGSVLNAHPGDHELRALVPLADGPICETILKGSDVVALQQLTLVNEKEVRDASA